MPVGTLDQEPGNLAAALVLPYTWYETLGQISTYSVDAESSVKQGDLGPRPLPSSALTPP